MQKEEKQKLKKDLLDNGLVVEALPKYITSVGLSDNILKPKPVLSKPTEPITINLPKNDGGIRQLSLPNPVAYIDVIDSLCGSKSFENILNKIEKNIFSHSKLIYDDGMFNIPLKNHRSKFAESQRDKMFISIGKKYAVKYDIEKFYDNIYTHYLPAGLIGFENAIKMYRGNIDKSSEYLDMHRIEKCMTNLCRGETKGIITGPYISRILSELLQSEIDKEIFEKINNNRFRRFVDDTTLYVNSVLEGEKALKEIKRIFQKYRLSLKMEKTDIIAFPYLDFTTIRDLLKFRKIKNSSKNNWYFASQDDFFENIDKAEKISNEGNHKGVLKYVFKTLANTNYEYGVGKKYDNKDISFSYLINYISKYPQYAQFISEILDKNIDNVAGIESVLNDSLKLFIDSDYEIAVLHIFGVLLKHKFPIDKEFLISYIEKQDANEIISPVFAQYLCEYYLEDFIERLSNVKTELYVNGRIDFKAENWLLKYVLFSFDIIDSSECEQDNYYKYFLYWKNNKYKFINFDMLNDGINQNKKDDAQVLLKL